jgi:hypothetical protein
MACKNKTLENEPIIELDGEYKLYGEAVPIIDMPLRQSGGGASNCKTCSQDFMDDAENPKPDGGKFDSMFGGYLSKVANHLDNKTNNKMKQTGGGGGVGYSFMNENYIAGNPEVRAYGKNMDPVLKGDGSLYFPKCGEPLCVGASGQTGGSRKPKKTSHSKLKMKRKMRSMRKSNKCLGAKYRDPTCTCKVCIREKAKAKAKMSKRNRRKSHHSMKGGADFRSMTRQQQSYPFDGKTSVLELNPTLQGRNFGCKQPEWGPECI